MQPNLTKLLYLLVGGLHYFIKPFFNILRYSFMIYICMKYLKYNICHIYIYIYIYVYIYKYLEGYTISFNQDYHHYSFFSNNEHSKYVEILFLIQQHSNCRFIRRLDVLVFSLQGKDCKEKTRTSSHGEAAEDNLQFECCSSKSNISTYFECPLLIFCFEII